MGGGDVVSETAMEDRLANMLEVSFRETLIAHASIAAVGKSTEEMISSTSRPQPEHKIIAASWHARIDEALK
jgi:hypothetical protein